MKRMAGLCFNRASFSLNELKKRQKITNSAMAMLLTRGDPGKKNVKKNAVVNTNSVVSLPLFIVSATALNISTVIYAETYPDAITMQLRD